MVAAQITLIGTVEGLSCRKQETVQNGGYFRAAADQHW
jgi:hypothetical protein